jgi:hypothetical protein
MLSEGQVPPGGHPPAVALPSFEGIAENSADVGTFEYRMMKVDSLLCLECGSIGNAYTLCAEYTGSPA